MSDLMIKIDNVSKKYKLGQIGGTTLKEELARKKAKLFNQEDPTRKIGEEGMVFGQTFMALNGVSFEVKKGERVGIIGHNGAGKSTLLKLLSRITAPSSGAIGINGRITSMLEVGTGFHGELTGRENIYMNGAILGMTKKEIDAKIENIIEFSECRKFIDTPVKRYSSGMYVKLAFSVAAHLDSEIMIMDEVLAVGDMAFQTKCLQKMRDVASSENRAILYVSHNMNTIRQLCDRCVVLEKGKLIFDGDVEKAIEIYSGNTLAVQNFYDYSDVKREGGLTEKIHFISLSELNDVHPLRQGDTLKIGINMQSEIEVKHAKLRLNFYPDNRDVFATALSDEFVVEKNSKIQLTYTVDTSAFSAGKYRVRLVVYEPDYCGNQIRHDCIDNAFSFEVLSTKDEDGMEWQSYWWGNYKLPNMIRIE